MQKLTNSWRWIEACDGYVCRTPLFVAKVDVVV